MGQNSDSVSPLTPHCMSYLPSPDAIQYPWGALIPSSGQSVCLQPGLLWVRMPLPFALNHINVWLLADALEGTPGWTVVDTGLDNDDTRQFWLNVWERDLDRLPVQRLLVTHLHPDHVAGADWITRHWSEKNGSPCRLWMSATDFSMAHLLSSGLAGESAQRAVEHYQQHGVRDEQQLQRVRDRGNYYGSMVRAVPSQYARLLDGQTVKIGDDTWECIAGYGHAPEHMSLYSPSRGILIAGDMLLPRISTNVSVSEREPEADPLHLFLYSLRRLETLPPETLVLPSHGMPFKGIHCRVSQLRAHHHARLVEVLEACQTGTALSAADLLPVLFKRPLDTHQLWFALGESMAHIHWLWHRGFVRRTRDDDGIFRFQAVSSSVNAADIQQAIDV